MNNIIELLRTKSLFYELMREKHKTLYAYMHLFDLALNELEIKYTLYAGSQLAQRRMGEILPYDDDIDLAISEIDYKKLTQEKTLYRLASEFGIILTRNLSKNPASAHYRDHHKLFLVEHIPTELYGKHLTISYPSMNYTLECETDKDEPLHSVKRKDCLKPGVGLFLHRKQGKNLYYSHYGRRESIIPVESYDNKKLQKFGPLFLPSTEYNMWIKEGCDVDDVPYVIFPLHDDDINKKCKLQKKRYTLTEQEVDFIKNFSFNISFDELEIDKYKKTINSSR